MVPGGGVRAQYDTLSTTDICAVPVPDVAARDAVLFLWATNPLLPEAVRVVDAWGFTWKTMLTWCKPRLGTGYWLRGMTEHLVIATRGHPALPANPPPSVAHLPAGAHSEKPRALYGLCEALGPPPRLELFARQRRHGWAAWGDQVSRLADASLEAWAP